MAYNFMKTKEQMEAGVKKIPSTITELNKMLKDIGLAGAEYAIMGNDFYYVQKLYDEMTGKYATMFKDWLTQKNSPIVFNIKDGVFAIGKGRVEALTKNMPESASDEVKLAAIWEIARKALSENSWEKVQRVTKAEKEAAMTAEEKIKADEKKKASLEKAAKKQGFVLVEKAIADADTQTRYNVQGSEPSPTPLELPAWINELNTLIKDATEKQQADILSIVTAIMSTPVKNAA